jgi:hypothetical protein
MKKFLISFLVFSLGLTGMVKAENTDITSMENVIYIAPFSASAGSQVNVSICMKNTVAIRGFQFDLNLPDGVTVVTNDKGRIVSSLTAARLEEGDEHTLTVGTQDDGAIRFLCGSQYDETFVGNDGEIATVTVTIAADLAEGDYSIQLKNIKLTETDISRFYETELLESTITIEESDGRIHFDENATSMPTYTAGEKGNVTMARTITANEWSTIILPFTLSKAKAEAVFGSDVQLAEFSGFETEYSDEDDVTPDAIIVNFATYTMTTKKGMTGGKPFLIKTSKNITTIEADEVSMVSSITPVTKTDEYDTNGTFTGSLIKTKVPEDCLFLSENKFWYSVGKTNIKAFRGWFDLEAVLDKETAFDAKFFFNIDGAPTKVGEITMGQAANGKRYDLSGRHVTKTPTKGVYVIDGKKQVIK